MGPLLFLGVDMTRIILAALLCLSLTANAEYLTGRVIRVADGDTITILDSSNTQHKIRLSGIDAPERKQAFGMKSKDALSSAVAGKSVTIDWNKRDRYKRIVGKVLLDGKDMNLEQIKKGLAWHYKAYEREQDVEDRSVYANAEYEAQQGKVGLWTEQEPLAPWDFRSRKRQRPH
jgi:endonuclease YncB( thermonuclease family)